MNADRGDIQSCRSVCSIPRKRNGRARWLEDDVRWLSVATNVQLDVAERWYSFHHHPLGAGHFSSRAVDQMDHALAVFAANNELQGRGGVDDTHGPIDGEAGEKSTQKPPQGWIVILEIGTEDRT